MLRLVPALLLAAGLLAGTALARAWPEPGLVLIGPALLAATMVGAGLVGRRVGVVNRGGVLASVILAASALISCAIVAAEDPADVARWLPILGGGGALPLITGGGGCCHRAELRASDPV